MDKKYVVEVVERSGGVREYLGSVPPITSAVDTEFEFVEKSMYLMSTTIPESSDGRLLLDTEAAEWQLYDLPAREGKAPHKPIPGTDICTVCEDVEVQSLVSGAHTNIPELGLFKDMADCSSCNLCRLLTGAFEAEPSLSQLKTGGQDASSFVVLEVLPATTPFPSERCYRTCEIRGILVDGVTRQVHATVRLRLLADYAPSLKMSPIFRGRAVDSTAAGLHIARFWIFECCLTHRCDERALGARGQTVDKLRVIDTERECLTIIPWSNRYITLSYVWPHLHALRLVRNNSNELHRHGALRGRRHKLPRVIRDAMDVVRDLGERYLWVDALCITQDDNLEKVALINAMGRVYGHSFLTLVVATSKPPSQDYGIPGINGTPRFKKQVTAEVYGVGLVTALPDYHTALKHSVWSTRGWTFQEGILSKRCLIFSDYQIYFRCASDSRSEDVQAEYCWSCKTHPAKPEAQRGPLDYIRSDEFLRNTSAENTFLEYSQLVSNFTPRIFTYKEDVLNAFKGIMTAVAPYFPQEFLFGLPVHIFDQAILWYPASRLKRRESAMEGDSRVDLPTWSWAGWEGSVKYGKDSNHMGDCDTLKPTVQWWRVHQGTLTRLGNNKTYEELVSPATTFSHDVLLSHAHNLRPTQLIFWGVRLELYVLNTEMNITQWVKGRQTVPCFILLDGKGDRCGMLPSADRDWADNHKSTLQLAHQFLVLSYAHHSRTDGINERALFFHPKYEMPTSQDRPRRPHLCNVMLVECENGVWYRRGVGRIHADVAQQYSEEIDPEIMVLG